MKTSSTTQKVVFSSSSSVKIPKKMILSTGSDEFDELKKTYEKEFETLLKDLVIQHCDSIRVTVEAAFLGATAATIAFPAQFLSAKFRASILPYTKEGVGVFNGPASAQAGNMAVIAGIGTGVYWITKSIRKGKEDFKTGLVAGFTGGFMGSLVCDMRSSTAIANGLLFGLCVGEVVKVKEKYLEQQSEQVLYNKTREMLSCLDLERYENNFKRGSITDKSLPFISDRQVKP